jgi:hypothetical protein
MHENRVESMIMGGAILKMNFRSQILMRLGNTFKYVLPYLVLYRFFAFVIMPNKNHKQSRLLFINEAKKLYQKEFIKWFKLTAEINPILKWFRQVELQVPTLYVMGNEDYMFLPSVRKVVESHYKTSQLVVFENCGHVVNVEKWEIFNSEVIQYIKNQKMSRQKCCAIKNELKCGNGIKGSIIGDSEINIQSQSFMGGSYFWRRPNFFIRFKNTFIESPDNKEYESLSNLMFWRCALSALNISS